MVVKKSKRSGSPPIFEPGAPVAERVRIALATLQSMGTERGRQSLVRFGIVAKDAFGVGMADIQKLAKRLGRDHELALGLWKTRNYEARLLTAYVGEPDALTVSQMDAFVREFDNWGVCDTVCFVLFDKSKGAWGRIKPWCEDDREFVRRAGFALLACLAGHDKNATETQFIDSLPFIERGAVDERNFVKKGVSWALRRIGWRSSALHGAAVTLATNLANSSDSASRWVGKDALRDLTRAAMVKRLVARESKQRVMTRRDRKTPS